MIQIIAVGKIKEKATAALIDEYLKRLGGFTTLNIEQVADQPNDNDNMDEVVKKIEGERIIARIKPHSYIVLLDLTGRQLTSEQLAAKIQDIYSYHSSNITFIIGGSLGVSPQVRQKADYIWKLSALTFPHNLVRILLLEQIYRSYKILNHQPYHK